MGAPVAYFGLTYIFTLFIMALGILSSVFLGLCVYNDALSKSRNDGVMWALLCGFLGLIPSIIYLFVRKDPPTSLPCYNCGYPSHPQIYCCPNCNAQKPLWPPVNEFTESKKKKAKNFLIATIVMWAASVVSVIVFVVAIMFFLFRYM